MKALSLQLLSAVALFTVLASTPAQAACSKETCGPIGPPLGGCEQIVYNNLFRDSSCTKWQTTGAVYLGTNGTDWYYDVYPHQKGELYQNVGIMPFNHVEATFRVEVLNRSAGGSERLVVELWDYGISRRMAVMATVSPSTPDKTYNFGDKLSSYLGRDMQLLFRVAPGSSPGQSVFRIRSAYLWSVEY